LPLYSSAHTQYNALHNQTDVFIGHNNTPKKQDTQLSQQLRLTMNNCAHRHHRHTTLNTTHPPKLSQRADELREVNARSEMIQLLRSQITCVYDAEGPSPAAATYFFVDVNNAEQGPVLRLELKLAFLTKRLTCDRFVVCCLLVLFVLSVCSFVCLFVRLYSQMRIFIHAQSVLAPSARKQSILIDLRRVRARCR
jgi:hypothetical protein